VQQACRALRSGVTIENGAGEAFDCHWEMEGAQKEATGKLQA
jgi:hypothetical protein